MKRLAIFAHYDPDGVIANHVIYYLRHLKLVSTEVLFASDCEINEGEAVKLEGLATLTFASRHHGYDFGSWRKCLEHVGFDLSSWDELIVVNDSCFAPLYPLDKTFDLIGECDFWGATQEWCSYVKAELRSAHYRHPCNRVAKKHLMDIREDYAFLNSYFMVFRKRVIRHPEFIRFWQGIEHQADKAAVIECYEMRLTKLLTDLGFKFKCLTTRAGTIFYKKYFVKVPSDYQFPWLRVMLCKNNYERVAQLDACLNGINYPRALIDDYMKRVVGTASPSHYFLPEEAPLWRYKRLIGLWMDACLYRIKRAFSPIPDPQAMSSERMAELSKRSGSPVP